MELEQSDSNLATEREVVEQENIQDLKTAITLTLKEKFGITLVLNSEVALLNQILDQKANSEVPDEAVNEHERLPFVYQLGEDFKKQMMQDEISTPISESKYKQLRKFINDYDTLILRCKATQYASTIVQQYRALIKSLTDQKWTNVNSAAHDDFRSEYSKLTTLHAAVMTVFPANSDIMFPAKVDFRSATNVVIKMFNNLLEEAYAFHELDIIPEFMLSVDASIDEVRTRVIVYEEFRNDCQKILAKCYPRITPQLTSISAPTTISIGTRQMHASLHEVLRDDDDNTGQHQAEFCSASAHQRYPFMVTSEQTIHIGEDLGGKRLTLLDEGLPLLCLLAFDATTTSGSVRAFFRLKGITKPKDLTEYVDAHKIIIEFELQQDYTGNSADGLQQKRRALKKKLLEIAEPWLDVNGNYNLFDLHETEHKAKNKTKPTGPKEGRGDRDQTGRNRWQADSKLKEGFVNMYIPGALGPVYCLSTMRQALFINNIEENTKLIQVLVGHALCLANATVNIASGEGLLMSTDLGNKAEETRRCSLRGVCDKKEPCDPDKADQSCPACRCQLNRDKRLAKEYADKVKNVDDVVDPSTRQWLNRNMEHVMTLDHNQVLDGANEEPTVTFTFTERLLTILRIVEKLKIFALIIVINIYGMVSHDELTDTTFKIMASDRELDGNNTYFEAGIREHTMDEETDIGKLLNLVVTEKEKEMKCAEKDNHGKEAIVEPAFEIERAWDMPLKGLLSCIRRGQENIVGLQHEVRNLFLFSNTSGLQLSPEQIESCKKSSSGINLDEIVANKLLSSAEYKHAGVQSILAEMCEQNMRLESLVWSEDKEKIVSNNAEIIESCEDPNSHARKKLFVSLKNQIVKALRQVIKEDQKNTSLPCVKETAMLSSLANTSCPTQELGNMYWRMDFPFTGIMMLPKPWPFRRDDLCRMTLLYHAAMELLLLRVMLMLENLTFDLRHMITQFQEATSTAKWKKMTHDTDTVNSQCVVNEDDESVVDDSVFCSHHNVVVVVDDDDDDDGCKQFLANRCSRLIGMRAPEDAELVLQRENHCEFWGPRACDGDWTPLNDNPLVEGEWHVRDGECGGRWTFWRVVREKETLVRKALKEEYEQQDRPIWRQSVYNTHHSNGITKVFDEIFNLMDFLHYKYTAITNVTSKSLNILTKIQAICPEGMQANLNNYLLQDEEAIRVSLMKKRKKKAAEVAVAVVLLGKTKKNKLIEAIAEEVATETKKARKESEEEAHNASVLCKRNRMMKTANPLCETCHPPQAASHFTLCGSQFCDSCYKMWKAKKKRQKNKASVIEMEKSDQAKAVKKKKKEDKALYDIERLANERAANRALINNRILGIDPQNPPTIVRRWQGRVRLKKADVKISQIKNVGRVHIVTCEGKIQFIHEY